MPQTTLAKTGFSTATEAALRKLKQDIMSGVLAPDSQLKMRELKSRYGIGASPMREALANSPPKVSCTSARRRVFAFRR